jgi:drug/metabolite transporter (DMT)-like permease
MIIPKEHRLAGQGAVLVTAFLWSTSGLLIKLVPWHPIVFTGVRSLVAAIFLIIIRLLFPSKEAVKNPPFPLWACAVVYALTLITFVSANKLTTSANAILLQYGAPIWAALMGWYLLKEKPHWEHWCALVVIIGGLFLFFRDGLGSGGFWGDSLAVFSGILFGAHSVFLRMMKDGNPRDAYILAHLMCVVICVPFIFLYPPVLSASSIFIILYMGIIQIGLSLVLFAYGIKRISAVQAMLIAMAEPVFNPLWVFIFIGEKPSVSALLGGGIIMAAVVTSSIIGMRRSRQHT